MPRKNQKHSLIVTNYLKSHSLLQGWKFIPIQGMNQEEVASVLRDSSLFLSFGHPEGFGLPVAEALACGCTVVGYSGIGGHELFQTGTKYACATEIPFGDFHKFISCVLNSVSIYESDALSISKQTRFCSEIIRRRYCAENFISSLLSALDKVQDSLAPM